MKKRYLSLIILSIFFLLSSNSFAKNITILAVDIYGDNKTSKQWLPTIEYLNTKIQEYTFSLISLHPDQVDKIKLLIQNKQVDFIITQPSIYVDLELNTGISKILTLIKDKGVSQLGSVIFAKKSSGIKTLQETKDKKIAAVAPLGFGGWLIGYNEFLKAGINLSKTSVLIGFWGTQHNVVDAVLDDKADVGIVRTSLLEGLAHKGKLDLQNITIIHPLKHKNFPFISSSDLYPEWAFAKTPYISDEISKKIAIALLTLPAGSKIAVADHYWEWTTPYDYKPVHDLLKKLEAGAYKDYKKITFERYKYQIIFLIGAFITIISLLIGIIRRNIIIKEEEKKNIELQEQFFRSEKLTSMGELIGNIAHQWRQPLSIISIAATGLKLKKEQGSLKDEDVLHACDSVNDNAQYLSRTIDNFTNYIKKGSKKEDFSIKKNINNFIYFVEGSMDINHIDIMLDIEDSVCTGYPNKLIQCYINLFNNSKEQFLELDIKERYIFISACVDKENLSVKFKDNANGIDQNIITNIFEPYFTTKHKYQGKGLGLHNTYNIIVNEMKGSIKAHNTTYNYNKKIYSGVEFIIQIPLQV